MMAERQIASFYVGNDFLGVDVRLVREIHKCTEITPVSPAPDYVAGLLNLRGQIVTVIDLGLRIGIKRQKHGTCANCVVLKTSRELDAMALPEILDDGTGPDQVAFLVDTIGDIVIIDPSLIVPPPAHVGAVEGRFLSGVAKLDGQLLVTLKVSEILRLEDVV
ncbi:MAG: hypothetical protein C0404_04990 [Verrucomicrobia bacterium]|nr:hypothetical protein [Verrucomicrobiota bacterium]